MERNEMQGRFRIFYDFDMETWFFATLWDDVHKQKRTITEEQATVLKDIMMGGHLEVSVT